ncbi:MAG: hypothetical protein ACI4I9_08850 [Porcipelethomonas sp.]
MKIKIVRLSRGIRKSEEFDGKNMGSYIMFRNGSECIAVDKNDIARILNENEKSPSRHIGQAVNKKEEK